MRVSKSDAYSAFFAAWGADALLAQAGLGLFWMKFAHRPYRGGESMAQQAIDEQWSPANQRHNGPQTLPRSQKNEMQLESQERSRKRAASQLRPLMPA